jgi:hypothetical protein
VDEAPDYSAMAARDLEDVARNIDREAFPERWTAVREELRRRVNEPRAERAPQPWHRAVAALQAIGAIGVVFVLIHETGLTRIAVILLLLADVIATFELWWGSRRGFVLSVILQALQIVSVSTAGFTFIFHNGPFFLATARFGDGEPFEVTAGYGTNVFLNFGDTAQDSIDVNLVALAATLILIHMIRINAKMWKISVTT